MAIREAEIAFALPIPVGVCCLKQPESAILETCLMRELPLFTSRCADNAIFAASPEAAFDEDTPALTAHECDSPVDCESLWIDLGGEG